MLTRRFLNHRVTWSLKIAQWLCFNPSLAILLATYPWRLLLRYSKILSNLPQICPSLARCWFSLNQGIHRHQYWLWCVSRRRQMVHRYDCKFDVHRKSLPQRIWCPLLILFYILPATARWLFLVKWWIALPHFDENGTGRKIYQERVTLCQNADILIWIWSFMFFMKMI